MPRTAKTKRTPPAKEAIGDRLARLRRRCGLTQGELGKQVGLDQTAISDHERGVRRLHGELIVELARILKVSSDELLGLSALGNGDSPIKRPFLRRLRNIDRLSEREQRALIQMLDAFLDRAELRRQRPTEASPPRLSRRAG